MSFLKETGLEGLQNEGGGDDDRFLRFFVKKGTTKEVIFLTEAETAKSFFEHRVKIGNTFNNFFTCLRCIGESCPMCEYSKQNDSKDNQSYARAGTLFTVLDVTPYENKDGKEVVTPRKRLLVAGSRMLTTISATYEVLKKSGHSLRGYKFIVQRTPKKMSLSTGDVWIPQGSVDLSDFEDVDELDYQTILAPDRAKMEAALKRMVPEKVEEPEEVEWDAE